MPSSYVPTNKKLYEKIKKQAKKKFTKNSKGQGWPSAYASGWLVKEYKRQGGKYKNSKVSNRKNSQIRKKRKSSSSISPLSRWYKEKWVDVCYWPKRVPCGRKSSSSNSYPYCRPSVKVSKSTPRLVQSLSPSERRERCKKKRRNPKKRIY
jgi:hypothetical protein